MGVWLTSLIPPGAFVSSLITYNPDFGGFITIQAPPGVPLNQIVLNANVLVGGDLTVNRAVNAVFYQLNDGTGAGADTSVSRIAPGVIGIGTGTDGSIDGVIEAKFINIKGSDVSLLALFAGDSKAIRIEAFPDRVDLDAVDQTGSLSYQPLFINGSIVNIANGGPPLLQVAGGLVAVPGTLQVGTLEVTSPQTYTPTAAAGSNIASITFPDVAVYTHIGNVVCVSGVAAITTTGSGTVQGFATMSVPITSPGMTLSTANGFIANGDYPSASGRIGGNSPTTVVTAFYGPGGVSLQYSFMFQYRII